MTGELRLVGIFDCPNRIVSMYSFSALGHPKHGRFFFCIFPSTWVENFDTVEATQFFYVDKKEKPDIIWDGDRLNAVK